MFKWKVRNPRAVVWANTWFALSVYIFYASTDRAKLSNLFGLVLAIVGLAFSASVLAGYVHSQMRRNEAGHFPLVWYLLKFLVSRETRERIFLPAYYDLLADYLETRRPSQRSKLVRYWLNFCLSFRTMILMLDCLSVGLKCRIVGILAALIPLGLKNWLRLFFIHWLR